MLTGSKRLRDTSSESRPFNKPNTQQVPSDSTIQAPRGMKEKKLLDFTQLFPFLALYKQTKQERSVQQAALLARTLDYPGQDQPAAHTVWLCHIWELKVGICSLLSLLWTQSTL